MSSTEKKALKKILVKLKEKTLESVNRYLDRGMSSVNKMYELARVYDKLVEAGKRSPEELPELLDELRILLNMVQNSVVDSFKESLGVIKDLRLYSSSLEEYSIELDNNLQTIFNVFREKEEKLKDQMEKAEEKKVAYID